MSKKPNDGNEQRSRDRRPSRLARLADETGSVFSIEFALVAPIMLGLLFGIMDVGRLMFTQAVLYFAVQETTRFSTVTPPTGDPPDYGAYETMLATYAKNQVILIDPSNVKPEPVVSPTPNPDDTRTVTVRITYDFEWMMPFVGDGTIRLTSESAGFLAENS